MSDDHELMPIGTEFETVRETRGYRIIERYRVIGHQVVGGMLVERTKLIRSESQRKTPIGGSERK